MTSYSKINPLDNTAYCVVCGRHHLKTRYKISNKQRSTPKVGRATWFSIFFHYSFRVAAAVGSRQIIDDGSFSTSLHLCSTGFVERNRWRGSLALQLQQPSNSSRQLQLPYVRKKQDLLLDQFHRAIDTYICTVCRRHLILATFLPIPLFKVGRNYPLGIWQRFSIHTSFSV